MPLVRVDLPATLPPADVAAIPDAVHQALVAVFTVPADDRFQVVSRHEPGGVVCAPQYLGVQHTGNAIFVQITCAPGRTVDMKQALYREVAGRIARCSSVGEADVIINLVESARENWSFGNGIAHYVPKEKAA